LRPASTNRIIKRIFNFPTTAEGIRCSSSDALSFFKKEVVGDVMYQQCKFKKCIWEARRNEQIVFCLFPHCIESDSSDPSRPNPADIPPAIPEIHPL